jgi:hypothetical protein
MKIAWGRIALAAWLSSGTGVAAADGRDAGQSISVRTSAELLAALAEPSGVRQIHLQRGEYSIDEPLQIRDGMVLTGDGEMSFDESGIPRGFAPGTETVLAAAAGFAGDLLTLGNETTIRGLVLRQAEDRATLDARRAGNVVVVASRAADDRVTATIVDCEIVNPNPPWFTDNGPSGRALAVLTLSKSSRGAASHEGAKVDVRASGTAIRGFADGGGVFAINFASRGEVSLSLSRSRIEGTLVAAGGTNRPDSVADAATTIDSQHNLYTSRAANGVAHGWWLYGGSSPPHFAGGPVGARFDTLRVHSVGDRIEGVSVGIRAAAGRRVLASSGPISHNVLDLDLRDLRLITTGDDAADFQFYATEAGEPAPVGQSFDVGDGNTLRVRMERVVGSGTRSNVYAAYVGPTQRQTIDADNRIEFVGDAGEFAGTNSGIQPMPPADDFVKARD